MRARGAGPGPGSGSRTRSRSGEGEYKGEGAASREKDRVEDCQGIHHDRNGTRETAKSNEGDLLLLD